MSYHCSGPQFPHQSNGVVIPTLRWGDLARCLVLSLQVSLPSRLLALYPTPSSKSHPATSNKILSGRNVSSQDARAESVIAHFDFPRKLAKQAGYPPSHMNEAVPPSLDPILLSLLDVCSHESLTLLYHVTQYSNNYLHYYLSFPLRLHTQ